VKTNPPIKTKNTDRRWGTRHKLPN